MYRAVLTLLALLAVPVGAFGQFRIVDQGKTNPNQPWWIQGTIACSNCGGSASVLMADNTANPTIPQTASFGMIFDGANWDRWTGAVSATDLDIRNLDHAQDDVRIGDGTDLALVSGSGSLQVTCDNCGGASSFEDNDVFTGGTSAVGNIGALYDTTPPAITDGSAGIPRMNSSRMLLVDGSGATQPVSGTFWQATQPVSGTVTVTDGGGALNVIVDSSALPAGAATEATLATRLSETAFTGSAAGQHGTINAGTLAATTTAAAVAANVPAVQVLVQNDPDNTVDILCGNATTQPIQMKPGDGLTMNVTNVNLIFCKTVSSTGTVAYVAR